MPAAPAFTTEEETCKHCSLPLIGPYCANCGQKRLERLNNRYLVQDVFYSLIDVDKGFLYTTKSLLLEPWATIRNYWAGNTVSYFHPIRYMVICTALALIVMTQTGLLDSVKPVSGNSASFRMVEAARKEMFSYFNIIMMATVPLKAWITFKLYRRYKPTYAEVFYMQCFLYGFAQIFLIPGHFMAQFFLGSDPHLIWRLTGQLLQAIYFVWVAQHLWGGHWLDHLWRAISIAIVQFLGIGLVIMTGIFLIILYVKVIGV